MRHSVNLFKTTLLGASFLIAASAAASAADVYGGGGGYKDEPAAYLPAVTWTGFYLGVNAGSSFDDTTSVEVLGFDAGSFDIDSAFVGGVQFGYNWQMPSNLVLGIEADLGIQNDELDLLGTSFDVTSYLASIRARLGYAFGKTLVYGTGGVAFQGYDDDVADILSDDPSIGWVVGGGVDFKLASNVSFGVEGLYYNFENDIEDVIDLERDFWTVRARLNYHFTSAYDSPLK